MKGCPIIVERKGSYYVIGVLSTIEEDNNYGVYLDETYLRRLNKWLNKKRNKLEIFGSTTINS